MRHVLCFGDSNTWGFIPGSGQRYEEHTRWTGVLADLLGEGWRVHEDGLNARTSAFPSPFKPFLNGIDALPIALWAQKPIDVLVIALGTNDLKTNTARHAASGVARLVAYAKAMDTLYPSATPVFRDYTPRILVISPIAIGENLDHMNPYDELAGKHMESLAFPAAFADIVAPLGVTVLNAQRYAEPSPVDCVHMSPESHRALAQIVADAVRQLMV